MIRMVPGVRTVRLGRVASGLNSCGICQTSSAQLGGISAHRVASCYPRARLLPAARFFCESTSNVAKPRDRGKELRIIVESNRVDSVAAKGCGLSRRSIRISMLEGDLYHNGLSVVTVKPVCNGDIIQLDNSKAKFQRVVVLDCNVGCTAKGRLVMNIKRHRQLHSPA